MEMETYDTKYLAIPKFGTIKLTRNFVTGLWFDEEGTVWPLVEEENSVDSVDRCGVGFFSLDPSNPLTRACGVHDWSYSSKGYQMFHTRYEADIYLANLVENSGTGFWRILKLPFYLISRAWGSMFWENDKTR